MIGGTSPVRLRITQQARCRANSAGGAVFLRVQELGEAWIFLKEGEVFIIARVIAVLRAERDRNFEIGHGGISFTREAIERGESVMDMVGFRRCLARFEEAFASVVPAADVHHGDAALIMIFSGARVLLVAGFHTLFGDLQVHASTIGKLSAGTFKNFLELLLGAGKFLLMKQGESFIIKLELGLNARIDQFYTAALSGRRRP
jgi:hypothetical protein